MFLLFTEPQPFWPNCWLCHRGISVVQLRASHTFGTTGHLPHPFPWQPQETMCPGRALMCQPQRPDIRNTCPHLPLHKQSDKNVTKWKNQLIFSTKHQLQRKQAWLYMHQGTDGRLPSSYSQEKNKNKNKNSFQENILCILPHHRKGRVIWCFRL